MSTQVLFETVNSNGIITLNRPKELNCLNLNMLQRMYAELQKCLQLKANLVIMKSCISKAFCAGGDVKEMVGGEVDIFRAGYTLIGLIGTYRLPYIALIDGITMGGGVGISINGSYRVCTERTVFAMPETTIGFFPDVGGSYFLPRLEGKLGYYLSMTGTRLKGKDVFKAGIATHYVLSESLPALEKSLLKCSSKLEVEEVLNRFSVVDAEEFSLRCVMSKLNYCFGANTVEGIFENLQEDGSDWALDTLRKLKRASPTSLKVTFRELNLGRSMDLLECLNMEFRLAYSFAKGTSDLREGVRSFLARRNENPRWNPSTIHEVTNDNVVNHFKPLPQDIELKHKL